MAGQKIDREARFALTGMTGVQRDQFVWDARHRGLSYAQIGAQLGMAKSAVKYIFDRLNGHPRQTTPMDVCDGCWRDLPKAQLNRDGLCEECRP